MPAGCGLPLLWPRPYRARDCGHVAARARGAAPAGDGRLAPRPGRRPRADSRCRGSWADPVKPALRWVLVTALLASALFVALLPLTSLPLTSLPLTSLPLTSLPLTSGPQRTPTTDAAQLGQ